ncbi:MAG: DMT family transporter [Hyphomicrobiales bacterium]
MPSSAASLAAPHRSHRAARGRLLLILSALAFSTAGFFTREAPVDLWAMVFWRNLFGSAALVPLILASKGGASWRSILLLGRWGWATIAASSFATICFLAALARTSVANVSIIYATAPLMTALIAWLWLREKATRRTIGAAVLALFGVAVTASGSLGGGTLSGDGLALLMAISLSLMTVIARRHARLPPLPTACIASLVAASAVLPLGWVSSASFVVTWQAAAWLAGFGIMTMAVALPCYLSGAAQVPAGQAMLISASEMPLAPLWVWLAFAETPSSASLIGGGVVALAIIFELCGSA